MFIVAGNSTGSAISADTELFRLNSSIYPETSIVAVIGHSVGTTHTSAIFRISNVNGVAKIGSSFGTSDYIYICLTYAIA